MAFWGVEVKPGKRFTHDQDDSKGRLHISMATLGFGSATAKSTLQCNVGNRSPVYLCSLYPGRTESLQLNLELEEADEVIFTVIGPRSIHLCGYYIGRGGGTARYASINDDSEETYGEDIAETETQSSDDSDEYGGSFIDDDAVPEVFPPTPISNEEEASHENRTKGRKGRFRRLRKKYQSVESDDDWNFKEKIIINDNMHDQTIEIDDEDGLPISSVYKTKASRRILDEEMDDSGDRGAGDASNRNGEEGSNHIIQTDLTTDNVLVDGQMHRKDALADHLVDPCTVLAALKMKKKGKGKEIMSSFNGDSIKHGNTLQDEPKMDKVIPDLLTGHEQNQEHADDKDIVDPCNVLDATDIETFQKKKEGKGKEIKSSYGESIEIENTGQDEPKMDKATPGLVTGNEQNQEHADDMNIVDPCTDLDAGDTETLKEKDKGKGIEINSSFNVDYIKLVNTMQNEPKMDKATPGLVTGNEQNQEHADDTDIVDPCTDLDAGDTETLKEKEKGKGIEINSSFNVDSIKLVNTMQNEPKMDKVTPGLVTGNEQNQEHADEMDIVDPCTDLDAGDIETLKEKEKGKGVEIKTSFNGDSIKLVNTMQNEPKMDKVTPGLVTGNEQNQEHVDDKDIVDACTDLDAGDTETSNGKEQGKGKEIKSSFNGDSIMPVNTLQNEPKMDEVTPSLLTRNEQNQEHADDMDIVDPCADLDAETLKEKEKGNGIEIKTSFNGDSIKLVNTAQPKMDVLTPDLVTGNEQNQEHAEDKDIVDPCTDLDAGDTEASNGKERGEGKEIMSSFNDDSIKLANTEQDEPKMDEVTPDLQTGNEQRQEHADDRETETMDKMLPSSETGHEQGEKPKKKRKERSREGLALIGNAAHDSHLVNLPQRNEHDKPPTVNKNVELADNYALLPVEKDSEKSRTKRRKKKRVNKGTHVEGDIGYHEGFVEECKAKTDKADSDHLIHNFSEGKEQHHKPTNEKSVDYGAHDFPDGIQNEEKLKKRKKKSKSQGNIEVNSELPLSVEQSSEMEKENVNKRANAKHSQVRTLSNGLVIQELEMGKKDGKIAAPGKKISIHYTGKLKESGEVIESNAGQAPFKFRLGKGKVIECWDVGLEGMRVGGKRRLVIPPSITSESEEYRGKVPPNSWLVYDFELVKVR